MGLAGGAGRALARRGAFRLTRPVSARRAAVAFGAALAARGAAMRTARPAGMNMAMLRPHLDHRGRLRALLGRGGRALRSVCRSGGFFRGRRRPGGGFRGRLLDRWRGFGRDRRLGGGLFGAGDGLFARFASGLRGRRRDRLGGRGGNQRDGDGQSRTLGRGVAERLEDRGESLARTAGQRGHRHGDDEAFAIRRAGRRIARRRAGLVGDGRANEIGEALQNIDAHDALAADAETGGAVEALVDRRVGGEGGAARCGEMRHFLEPLHLVETAMLQGPEEGGQRARRGLQQQGQIEMIGAKAHAELAQRGAVFLREALDVLGDAGAVENAELFGELEGDAARHALESLAFFQRLERAEQFLHMLGEPEIEPRLHFLQRRAGELLVGENAGRGGKRVRPGGDLRHGFAEPADHAVIAEHEGVVDGVIDAGRARLEFSGERLLRRRIQGFGGLARRAGVRREAETLETSDMLAFDQDVAGGVDFGFEHRILS